jgi:endonuclease/exonuclease/phosphatase family metal-dependent hydrolase
MKQRAKAVWICIAFIASAAVACGAGPEATECESNATAGRGAAGEGESGQGNVTDAGEGGAGDWHSAAAGSGGSANGFELRALSYNSALAPDFEPFTSERKVQIETALASLASQLDLLCVQEYWMDQDFDALARQLADDLPHRLRQGPKPGSGSCNEHDLNELGGCLAQACLGQSGVELVVCAQTECAPAIQEVDGGCLGCFLDHLDDQRFDGCQGDGSTPSDPALFGGAFDVGLLSRYPLTSSDALEYDAYFVRGSALYAQIEVPGLGAVDTFCTHLGSSLGVIPYQGPHRSWDGEHSYQVAQLLGFIANKTNGKNPVLVLGDLNTGPDSAGPPPISGELPLDYRLVLASGLVDTVSTPFCTICSDNALSGGARDLFIDHALLRGFATDTKVTAARLLQQTFQLHTPQGTSPMNLSDHYGLRVELRSR